MRLSFAPLEAAVSGWSSGILLHEESGKVACRKAPKETIMRDRFRRSAITVAIAVAAVGGVIFVSTIGTSAQAPVPILKTPWGEPDLQGIWTDETDTPLQRSPKFANQEFFTPAQRAELDQQRSALPGR